MIELIAYIFAVAIIALGLFTAFEILIWLAKQIRKSVSQVVPLEDRINLNLPQYLILVAVLFVTGGVIGFLMALSFN